MMIKNNHKNVDMQGLVYLPYLHTWSNSSNLVIIALDNMDLTSPP